MEKYEGVKFRCRWISKSFNRDNRLAVLNRWVYIFAELGLAPVHAGGAYGNHSFRVEDDSFLITKTGMLPQVEIKEQDYCLVENYNEDSAEFSIRGKHEPSSESFLHFLIYRSLPHVKTIMHGHSNLLNRYAIDLGIPETSEKHPYGTIELARSALDILNKNVPCIILKDHGFVAVGDDINSTGNLVLDQYVQLLDLLKS